MNGRDDSIPPVSFPSLSTQEVQETTPLVKVCEEDLKNVSVQFDPEVSIGMHTDVWMRRFTLCLCMSSRITSWYIDPS